MKTIIGWLPLCAGLLFSLSPHDARAQISDPVRIDSGLLSGTSGTEPSVRVFKGIPYAAPPVGDLRWRAPQPPAPWDGVRKADQFGNSCIQNVAGSRLPWTEEFMVQNAISEDCLDLNVWTAAETPDERRPVLVFLHGGGFTEGSGSIALYNGENLARKGLVVVTINYRLGLLGFFAHPDLTKESEHQSSGNYGLLDQVAALQWVRKNIAAFGGNPKNVTIAGQSAGAASVHLLMASPLAKGLFQRGIAESGSSVGGGFMKRADAEQQGVKFAEAKGAPSIRELRALSPAELTAPVDIGGRLYFGPIVDGWFLPDDVNAILARGKQNDVPVLTGLNADEGSAFSPNYGKQSAEEYRNQARRRYGDRADAFLKLYPADTEEDAAASQIESQRDQGLVSMALWAKNRARTSKKKTYLYYFDRAIPWPAHPEFAAFHTSEIPYVFDNLKLLDRPWDPVDWKVADTVSAYWVNFATTGDPNDMGLPEWPAFDSKTMAVMRLGEKLEPKMPPEPAKLAFFEQSLAPTPAK